MSFFPCRTHLFFPFQLCCWPLHFCVDWHRWQVPLWFLPSYIRGSDMPLHHQVSSTCPKFNCGLPASFPASLLKLYVYPLYVSCSCLPWYEVFYKLLNYLAEVLNRNENNSVAPLLRTLHEQQMPSAGAPVEVVTPSLHEVTFLGPKGSIFIEA